MGRGYLGWSATGLDSQRWKDWMHKEGDGTVKRAAEKQSMEHTGLKHQE